MFSNPFERGLAALVLGLASVQVGAIGASVLGLTLTRPAALMLLVSAIAIAGLAARVGGGWSQPADIRQTLSHRVDLILGGTISALALLYVSLWGIAHVYPDLTCDGNAYHIPTIHQWACVGRIHWIDLPGCSDLAFINGYPKGVETVAFVLATALASSHWINAINLVFLPLGVLGLAAMCRALGLSNRLSLCAGCTWIAVPLNVFQANTTYCDSAFASCAVAWFALTFLVARAAITRVARSWHAAVSWGAALGLVLSAKGTGGILAAVGTCGLGVFLLLAPGNRTVSRMAATARFLAIGLLTAVLTGGFWYIRNWLVTGSPLYPVGLALFGHPIFPGQSVAASIYALHNTPPEIRGQPWPWQVAQAWLQSLPQGWPASIVGVDAHLGGMGFLWLIGCFPSLAWLVWTSRRRAGLVTPAWGGERQALLFLAAVVMAAFLFTPMRWWARYTCWIYAAGIPPLAWLCAESIVRPPRLSIIHLWPTVLLVVMLGEAACGWRALVDQTATFCSTWGSGATPCATLRQMFPESSDTILETLCLAGHPIGLGPMTGQSPTSGSYRSAIAGPFSLPPGLRRVVGVDGHVNPADIARLNHMQVQYVIWSRALPLPPALRAAAETMEPVGGFMVIRLRAP